jgi:hypothetical protein
MATVQSAPCFFPGPRPRLHAFLKFESANSCIGPRWVALLAVALNDIAPELSQFLLRNKADYRVEIRIAC